MKVDWLAMVDNFSAILLNAVWVNVAESFRKSATALQVLDNVLAHIPQLADILSVAGNRSEHVLI
jgi:hypothetical protein